MLENLPCNSCAEMLETKVDDNFNRNSETTLCNCCVRAVESCRTRREIASAMEAASEKTAVENEVDEPDLNIGLSFFDRSSGFYHLALPILT